MKILPFDTESTDLITAWSTPSEDPSQPHMVGLAAVLVDDEDPEMKIIQSMDVLIKPDGWTISEGAFDVHKISLERAMDEGIPEADALDMFMDLYAQCDLRVAHNTTFDNRMLRIAMKRYYPEGSAIHEEIMRSWKEDKDKYFCTWMKGKKIMGGKSGHTLPEMYLHFTGKEMVGHHGAMADSMACMEIYHKIKDLV